jgi:hypothetical protein
MFNGKAVPLIGNMRQCQWGRHCQNFVQILPTCFGQVLRGVSARQVRAPFVASSDCNLKGKP